jgi:hypothetical protein
MAPTALPRAGVTEAVGARPSVGARGVLVAVRAVGMAPAPGGVGERPAGATAGRVGEVDGATVLAGGRVGVAVPAALALRPAFGATLGGALAN